MAAQRLFTGRNEYRHAGRVHFAEVTVRAAPRLGESQVELSAEALNTLREAFGADFEHQRHCVWSAVSAQIATANVAGKMPLAGATSFRAEVVGVRFSPDAGRDVSGFLLSAAGMNAIADYLEAWENEQVVRTGGMVDRRAEREDTNEAPEASAMTAPVPSGAVDTHLVNRTDLRSWDDTLHAACRIYYRLIRRKIDEGRTEGEIRAQCLSSTQGDGAIAVAFRAALENALAGRPLMINSPPES